MGNETQQKDKKKDEEEDSGIQIKICAGPSPPGDIADGALSDSEVECHRSSTHIVSDWDRWRVVDQWRDEKSN